MTARSSRVRIWSSRKSFRQQAYWDRHWEILNAAEAGVLWTPPKAKPVKYRWSAGDEFYIAMGKNLLCVEIVRRKYLPGGKPGYIVKVDRGAENERDEKTLIRQHDEAVSVLKAIPFRHAQQPDFSPPQKIVNSSSAIGWRNRLILSGIPMGLGSRYIQ